MYTTAGGQPSLQVARVGLRARGRACTSTARGTRGLRLPVQALGPLLPKCTGRRRARGAPGRGPLTLRLAGAPERWIRGTTNLNNREATFLLVAAN